MAKTVTGTVKSGKNAGATYVAAVREIFGRREFSLDVRAPWRRKLSEARADAERLGWTYVTNSDGSRMLWSND